MLVIRLQRVGKRNQASFRVVLQERSWTPKGKAKELLGFYNPVTKNKTFQKERIDYWISKGASPSPTIHNMLVDEGILKEAKVKAWQPKKKEKAPEAAAPAATAKEGEEEAGDAPAAETKEEVVVEPAPETVTTEEPAAEEKATEEKKDAPEKEEATEENAPAAEKAVKED